MVIVTAVSFLAMTQTFSPLNVLINSVVENGLLYTRPRSDQTSVRYTNKQVNKLTKEMAYHLSREITDTPNDSWAEDNDFYHNIVVAKSLKCDVNI